MHIESPKRNIRAPRSRVCYICGRQTLIAGYSHHVEQCKALFEKREALKPIRERRQAPRDPLSGMLSGKSLDQFSSSALDKISNISQQVYNESLLQCQFCGRKFLPDKLAIHNRSCRADNPARSVGGQVNRSLANTMGSNENHRKLPPSSLRHTSSTPASVAKSLRESPSSSLAYPDTGEGMGEFTPAMLNRCADCGRTFTDEAFARHSRVCRKVFVEKRKVFDSAAARARGTDLGCVRQRRGGQRGGERGGRSSSGSAGSKWKHDSASLRAAIRAARQVTKAQQESQRTGIPLHQLLPAHAPTQEDPVYSSYIECPTCGRKFNETAAARHIPKCRNIIAKPKALKAHSGHAATKYR